MHQKPVAHWRQRNHKICQFKNKTKTDNIQKKRDQKVSGISTAILEDRRQLKQSLQNPRILYSTKESIKYEGVSQTFSESLGESSFYAPILTELASVMQEYVFHQNKLAKSEKGREDPGNHRTKAERKYWKFPD